MTTIPKHLEELRDKIARKSMGMDCEERLLFDRAFNAAIQALSEGVEFDAKAANEALKDDWKQANVFMYGARWQHQQSSSVIAQLRAIADEMHADSMCAREERDAALAEVEQLTKRLKPYLHNHITRDIKERGECPSCDHWWATRERDQLRAECERLQSILVNQTLTFDQARELKAENERLKELINKKEQI